jgi:uncharacterized protein YaaN involved in tellurite resistance
MTDTTNGLQVDAPDAGTDLVAAPAVEVKQDDIVKAGQPITDDERKILEKKADDFAANLVSLNPKSDDFENALNDVANLGRKYFESTATTNNRFLKASVASESKTGSSNQVAVSKQLLELRKQVEIIAPSSEESFVKKAFSFLPGANSVRNYFKKYESNQSQLNAILHALSEGKDGLYKDNAALNVERQKLWSDMSNLNKVHVLLAKLDDVIVSKVASAKDSGDIELAGALEKDALFDIRQRRNDVVQQAAVTLQAYMAMSIIIKNNAQLIRGVDRAETTTVTALTTAVEVAQALYNQKLVLDQIDAVNSATNKLIDATSDMLQSNSARIQQQASSSGVSNESLNRAYDAIFNTLDSIDKFKLQANEAFSKNIELLDNKMQQAQQYIDREKNEQKGLSAVPSTPALDVE